MKLDELETDLNIILRILKLSSRKMSLVKEVSFQYIIEEFGVIICGLNMADYAMVNEAMLKYFGTGWSFVFVTTQDSLLEKKEEIIWELMRSGYMRYIRTKYPSMFKNLIVMDNFGRKIIQQRLNVWGDAPKYRFLKEDNEAAVKEASSYVLSMDPSFFDYMP